MAMTIVQMALLNLALKSKMDTSCHRFTMQEHLSIHGSGSHDQGSKFRHLCLGNCGPRVFVIVVRRRCLTERQALFFFFDMFFPTFHGNVLVCVLATIFTSRALFLLLSSSPPFRPSHVVSILSLSMNMMLLSIGSEPMDVEWCDHTHLHIPFT